MQIHMQYIIEFDECTYYANNIAVSAAISSAKTEASNLVFGLLSIAVLLRTMSSSGLLSNTIKKVEDIPKEKFQPIPKKTDNSKQHCEFLDAVEENEQTTKQRVFFHSNEMTTSNEKAYIAKVCRRFKPVSN